MAALSARAPVPRNVRGVKEFSREGEGWVFLTPSLRSTPCPVILRGAVGLL